MTYTAKMFWLAERVGYFSKAGVIVHSLLSALVVIPSAYNLVQNQQPGQFDKLCLESTTL